MIIEPLTKKQEKYNKQIELLAQNSNHPSLNTEKLIPPSLGLYSFRIDIHYRAIFRFVADHIKIISVTNHYHR